MGIEAGQEAPDFTLPDENGEQVTLSELRGDTVVLMFYPLDFSPLCTREHCDVRDNRQEWLDKGAKVFGISRDSRWTHAAYKEQENLPYSLLADMKGEVAQKFGVWNENAGIAERGTFVIDPEGKIAYAVHNGPGDGRHETEHNEVAKYL